MGFSTTVLSTLDQSQDPDKPSQRRQSSSAMVYFQDQALSHLLSPPSAVQQVDVN